MLEIIDIKKDGIGERVKIISALDVLDILKVLSAGTWIIEIPEIFIELINDDYDVAIETIRYVPNIYFKLSNSLREDRRIINATIRSFKSHRRTNEISIKLMPLIKNEEKCYGRKSNKN